MLSQIKDLLEPSPETAVAAFGCVMLVVVWLLTVVAPAVVLAILAKDILIGG